MVLAALGERESPGELTPEEKRLAKRQAFGVWWRSILAAVIATALIWLAAR